MSMLEKALSITKNAQNIMFLTGAGVSAGSGLPTYRGKNGLWNQRIKGFNPTIFATRSYCDPNANECWNHSDLFFNQVLKCSPNQAHFSIHKFFENSLLSGVDFDLVTQNIDGYHAKLINESPFFRKEIEEDEGSATFGLSKYVYEIHGNIHYMRCSREGCANSNLYKCPKTFDDIDTPRCQSCNHFMRRHLLLIDEPYSEKYYRSQTVLKKAKRTDLLFIAGTEMSTTLPKIILSDIIRREIDIIEFNLESHIKNYPNLVTINGKCEETIPEFVEKYISLGRAVGTRVNC